MHDKCSTDIELLKVRYQQPIPHRFIETQRPCQTWNNQHNHPQHPRSTQAAHQNHYKTRRRNKKITNACRCCSNCQKVISVPYQCLRYIIPRENWNNLVTIIHSLFTPRLLHLQASPGWWGNHVPHVSDYIIRHCSSSLPLWKHLFNYMYYYPGWSISWLGLICGSPTQINFLVIQRLLLRINVFAANYR